MTPPRGEWRTFSPGQDTPCHGRTSPNGPAITPPKNQPPPRKTFHDGGNTTSSDTSASHPQPPLLSSRHADPTFTAWTGASLSRTSNLETSPSDGELTPQGFAQSLASIVPVA